jgi:hypothetical protein
MNAAEPIDGNTATPAELRRAGIDALLRTLGPVGMARFLQQFDPGHGDYTVNASAPSPADWARSADYLPNL